MKLIKLTQPSVALGCAFLVALATMASAETTSVDKQQSAVGCSSGQLHHYGILGPVVQPGVYVSDQADLSLAELVAAAGGITADANRFAQVIRRGRSGVQSIYSRGSSDRLMAGDVVVFDNLAPPKSHGQIEIVARRKRTGSEDKTSPRMIAVAFVGITPDVPAVLSLPVQVASVPMVIAALNQHPTLVDAVKVIRTSHTAPRIPAGELPQLLVDGDVIVFPTNAINQEALADVQRFPPPYLIEPSPTESVATEGEVTGSSLRRTEPERSFEQSSLPTLATSAVANLDSSADTDPRAASQVVPTALMESPQIQEAPYSYTPRPAAAEPTTIERSTSAHYATKPAETANGFAPDALERVAMATPFQDQIVAAEQAAPRLAAIPEPLDVLTDTELHGFASRATTLGIAVLATALVCFVASLIWSRLDDSTGLPNMAMTADNDPSQATPLHLRGPLERLIENSFPLIEEQATLPDRSDYHGEAVGRQRLRIDTQHKLMGPHFSGAPRQTPELENVSDLADASGVTRQRVDKPSESPSIAEEAEGQATSQRPDGGLLDRVLMAMEREKQK